MKNLKFLLFTLIAVFTIGFAFNVNAEDVVSITNFEQLKGLETAEEGGTVKLDADIVMTDDVRLKKDFVLDLNGHSIDNSSSMTLILMSNVQIKDSSESKSGKIFDSESKDTGIYFPVQVGSGETAGGLVLESGTIEGRPAIQTVANANIEIKGGEIVSKTEANAITLKSNGKLTMNGGKITSEGYGIAAFEDTVVTINDGVISSNFMAVSGNGSSRGSTNSGVAAKFYINGGSLTAKDAPAIYLPQIEGETVIKDGVLTGSESAVEIRAGKLTVNGGTFNANTDHNGVNPNGNGSTTYGVALAVAQHTTKQPIDVTVNGGQFTGFVALKESNPQENSAEDISKVKVSVNGGTFTATSDDVVYSEDLEGFVNGGTFNKSLKAKYLADGIVQVRNGASFVAKKDISNMYVKGIVNKTYNGRAQTQNITIEGLNASDYSVTYDKNINAGTATVVIIPKNDNYTGKITKTFRINKAANPMVVTAKNKKVKYKKVRKKKQTVSAITVSKAQGNVTYAKVSGNKKISVNAKTGKITVKKKTKKGTYKIKVKVTAQGNNNYNAVSKTITLKIKVK